KNEQYAPAVESFRKALELKPDDPEAHCYLGVNQIMVGRPDDALLSFSRASEIDPADPRPHFLSGWAYEAKQDEVKSLAEYKQTIHAARENALGHYGLGVGYYRFGRYGRAVRPLKEAIRLDPSDPDARYEPALVYNKLGRRELAMEQYRALKQIDPEEASRL